MFPFVRIHALPILYCHYRQGLGIPRYNQKKHLKNIRRSNVPAVTRLRQNSKARNNPNPTQINIHCTKYVKLSSNPTQVKLQEADISKPISNRIQKKQCTIENPNFNRNPTDNLKSSPWTLHFFNEFTIQLQTNTTSCKLFRMLPQSSYHCVERSP